MTVIDFSKTVGECIPSLEKKCGGTVPDRLHPWLKHSIHVFVVYVLSLVYIVGYLI